MLNSSPKTKNKREIKDPKKIRQVHLWKQSDYFKASSEVHVKERASFDSTTEFLDNCINFHKKEIEIMLDSGIDIDCADEDNLTALHQACINAKLDLVIYLLNKNANINAVDKEGWTSLHIAANIGSRELAKCLLDRGAKLDIPNYDGDLPITLVEEKDYPELKAYLQTEMKKRNINEETCRNLERDVMMEDISHWKQSRSYNPPIDNINKSTPLHVAASKNYIDVLDALIPLLNEKQLNAQDSDGWTALHAAAHFGHLEACIILMKAGVNIDIVTNANETILDTVDEELKESLTENVTNFRAERLRNTDMAQPVPFRNDINNKRREPRTSIARQSVECKTLNQTKDKQSERIVLSNSGISNKTSLIESSPNSRVNDIFKPSKECTSISEKDEGIINKHTSKESEEDFTKTYPSVSSPSISSDNNDEKLVPQFKKLDLKDAGDGISDSDNIIYDIDLIKDDNIRGSNEVSDNSLCSSESEISNLAKDNIVKLREKSVRDSIQKHRTASRVSIVVAPEKCDESEAKRRNKARRVRSTRRCTQAINLGKDDIPQSNDTDQGELIPLPPCDNIDAPAIKFISPAPFIKPRNPSSFSTPPNALTSSHPVTPRPSGTSSIKTNDSFKHVFAKGVINHQLNKLINLNQSNENTNSSNLAQSSKVPSQVRKLETSNKEQIPINRSSSTSSDNRSVTNIAPEKAESVSGSFVAKPVLGFNRILSNNLSSQSNKHNTQSESTTTTNLNENSVKDGNSSCKSIADRLINDQSDKHELQIEVIKLKQEIQELKNAKNSKNEQTELNSDDDKISKLEMELLKTKEENKKVKLQNEALLRVISKIQQELESFQLGSKKE